MVAKESEIVDILKKKLELKKNEPPKEPFGNDYGVILRKNTFAKFNTLESPKVDNKGNSNSGSIAEKETQNSHMVNIVTNSSPSTRISFSNFDRTKEDYIRQFTERTRPISEVSPIKSQLEGIYSKESIIKPDSKATTELDIVFTTQKEEEEEKAKKAAAVLAMEKAFMKKKQLQEQKENQIQENEVQKSKEAEIEDSASFPIPAKRQSLKRVETKEPRPATEYREVTKTSKSQPAIQIVEFGSSGTDYSAVTKILDPSN